MSEIWIPSGARYIIQVLNLHGFKGYMVGGCVRDSLLGSTPNDWDLCTDAKPCEVKHCFREERVIETGLKHGTVTIVLPDGQYEVTTFRVDGNYSDNRHPDTVTFTDQIEEDLSRRDFSMNAIAYGPNGIIDPFGGVTDLDDGLIRCVGNPDARFQEDALRVLRALRFSSVYGFRIEEETVRAIHRNRGLLSHIAAERIQSELCKMLSGRRAANILIEFSDVITTIIPELAPCVGFDQNNRYHKYTVYDHIAHAVSNYRGQDMSVKIALLLHDVGKPQCYTEDENGGHFYVHGVPGHDLAEQVMKRLRFDNKTKQEVLDLVLYHDSMIEPTQKCVRRWLNKIGEHRFMQLLDVKYADILAHSEYNQDAKLAKCGALRVVMEEVLRERQCFTLKELAVNGDDVMRKFGLRQGRLVGDVLHSLLDKVINGELLNETALLLEEAEKYLKEQST